MDAVEVLKAVFLKEKPNCTWFEYTKALTHAIKCCEEHDKLIAERDEARDNPPTRDELILRKNMKIIELQAENERLKGILTQVDAEISSLNAHITSLERGGE